MATFGSATTTAAAVPCVAPYIATCAAATPSGFASGNAAGYADGYAVGYDDGFAAGLAAAPGFTVPQLTVVHTFSADFRDARLEQWHGTLADFPDDGTIVVLVKFANRNETVVARNLDGEWCWPFDVETAGDNVAELVGTDATVKLLPRGGWPATVAEIQIGAAKIAEEV